MEFGVSRNFAVKKGPILLLLKNTPFSGLDLQQAHIITDQGKIPSVEVEKLFHSWVGNKSKVRQRLEWFIVEKGELATGWRETRSRQNFSLTQFSRLGKNCIFKPKKEVLRKHFANRRQWVVPAVATVGRVKIISPGRFPATRENGHRGTNGANAISGIWQRRAFGFHCVATWS